jgi:hypothetical protein
MSHDFLVYAVVGAMALTSIAAVLLTRFTVKRRIAAILIPRLPGGPVTPSPLPGLAVGVGGSVTPYVHKHQAAVQAPAEVGEVTTR